MTYDFAHMLKNSPSLGLHTSGDGELITNKIIYCPPQQLDPEESSSPWVIIKATTPNRASNTVGHVPVGTAGSNIGFSHVLICSQVNPLVPRATL